MRIPAPRSTSVLGLLAAAAVTAAAAGEPPRTKDPAVYEVSGAYTFRTYCASCHGAGGKGDGPLAEELRFRPPDLTLLSRRNGGQYPAETVQRIIDGRSPLAGHGGPDMPIWGDAFRNADTGYDDRLVREKIRSVVDYLKGLQAD
jgi:mono/diheme cytochrome c family protein